MDDRPVNRIACLFLGVKRKLRSVLAEVTVCLHDFPPAIMVPHESRRNARPGAGCRIFLRTKSRTSTRSGTPSTLLSVHPLPLCLLSPPPEQLRRNGVGAPRCSPAESLSHLMGQKPVRAPPSTPVPNHSAIGF